jgi:hypothetical protein
MAKLVYKNMQRLCAPVKEVESNGAVKADLRNFWA